MRVRLKFQIGVVVFLFVGALAALWKTGTLVVARERRRASAGATLASAGSSLAIRGESRLAQVPQWPDDWSPEEWDDLDHRLIGVSSDVLQTFEGVEGGYFVRDPKRWLGASFPTEPKNPGRKRLGPHGPPPREADLIEIQADAAIRRNQAFSVVVEVPPSTVAIRTGPVLFEGKPIAATWTMTRLTDPIFLDQSVRGYRLAAALAVGGIVVALLLTIHLARTVGRQNLERERLQAELRRSERLAALGKLLAGVAHEVRNPLAGIRSTAQLWQRGIARDADSIDNLLDEVDRLDGIVERLLHFSKAQVQELSPGDLNALAIEAARLASMPAEGQEIRIETELASSLPPIRMSAPAVLQILRNLTTNAIQAMPDGGLIRISTRLDPSGHRVEVEVSDSGPGLDPETLAHLFEPFFTTRSTGTGLGLAIAREIALAHRGELRAGNREGVSGAVFTLVLPVGDPNLSPMGAANARLS